MYKAVILPAAALDVKEAADWYNEKKKGLGKRFTKEVRSKVKFICTNPETISIRYYNTRCILLEIFPFMIHFSIDEDQKILIISAVFHTSRNSGNWLMNIDDSVK